jgi:Protein of Unknown function (DUF2784)
VLWLHLPAAAWALVIVAVGVECPLTPLKKHLRHLAGQRGYSGGFLDYYLTGVIYPGRLICWPGRWWPVPWFVPTLGNWRRGSAAPGG